MAVICMHTLNACHPLNAVVSTLDMLAVVYMLNDCIAAVSNPLRKLGGISK